ncbi:hypothetical protein PUR59_08950 [Streptomyces sp. SP18ES09]|uniref:hypothetical protein n=1 Tax=Streptomyces sp. SP18ES09 TaxID=3002532 RepID=UPI002E75A8A9|nr:hypothetical protein [Streptomyces sp. SP18ES09]MEE1815142.1 hypothetical protein [Streptomyces sp. SP18ES09]
MPRRQGWFGSLSEGGKVTVIGSAIVGVSTLAAAILPSLLSSGDRKGTDEAKPPAQTQSQTPTRVTDPDSGTSSQEGTPEPDPTGTTPSTEPTTPTGPPAPTSYEVAYKDRTMSLSMARGAESGAGTTGSLDFDAPASRRYLDSAWAAEKEKAEESGVPLQPDLTYANAGSGFLILTEGRTAAQLQPSDPSEKAEDCAAAAQVGGFSEARLNDWQLPRKTVFCVRTDQGNIARVLIVDFVGGTEDDNEAFAEPPDQITLKVTLWKSSA